MTTITSRSNEEIIAIAKLHQTKYRNKNNRFIAEGTRTITTLIASGQKLEALYTSTDISIENGTILAQNVSIDVMKKISAAKTPSGILAVFQKPKKEPLQTIDSGIVFVEVRDPGNMGTLIRTASAMGKKTVVAVDSVDPWSPKVVQASAGTIGNVTIYQCSWQKLVGAKKNLALNALVVSEGFDISSINSKNSLLIIGGEANGIPPAYLTDCDNTITLSMPGKTESLNASVAGSIAMYLLWSR